MEAHIHVSAFLEFHFMASWNAVEEVTIMYRKCSFITESQHTASPKEAKQEVLYPGFKAMVSSSHVQM